MNPRTELVMARHRELKAEGLTGLEASRVVLKEAQEGTLSDETPVTEPNSVTPVTEPAAHVKNAVPKDGGAQPLVHPGRPKKHKTNAERQRAYRERSR